MAVTPPRPPDFRDVVAEQGQGLLLVDGLARKVRGIQVELAALDPPLDSSCRWLGWVDTG
jgi:hypothetical protein